MPTQKASQRDFRLVKPFVIFLLYSHFWKMALVVI